MPNTINISTSTIVRFFLIGFAAALIFYIHDIIVIVLAAVIIASAIEPFARRLERLKLGRVGAVIFAYLVIAAVFVGIIYLLMPVLLKDFSAYLGNLPAYLNYAQAWIPDKGSGILESSATLQKFSSTSFSLSQTLSTLSASFENLSEGFVRSVSALFGGVLSFTLIVVLSFYLSVQKDGVADFLRLITPTRHEKYILDLWRRSQEKIAYWMQGQLLLGVTVGVLVYLSLTIAGIQHALLLALLAAVFEIIPVFGPILSAVPGILVGFTQGGTTLALIVAGAYLLIQQFENHLFYPLVVKKLVGISPIVVILAMVVGAKFAGILGIILAVPLSTILMEYLRDKQKDRFTDAEVLYGAAGK